MNYEEFSPAAQKTIDQFRQIVKDIENRKNDTCTALYASLWDPDPTMEVEWTAYALKSTNYYSGLTGSIISFESLSYMLSLLNNCTSENKNICSFLSGKNYFFPALCHSSLKELARRYPFIAQ
jgi:hypothetical protein